MPIQLKLRDDLEEAVASYKHYDVLIENTGAHEELPEYSLSVNPLKKGPLDTFASRLGSFCALSA